MFVLCPTAKGRDELFIFFVSLRKDLPIPSYISGSKEYEQLKRDLVPEGFNEAARNTLSAWKRAKLTLRNMTREQINIVKEYVKGNIKW